MNKFFDFLRTASHLGPNISSKATIFWHLTKNIRVRTGLAHHHPDRVFTITTRFGPISLRDNFGDVTNLRDLLVDNVYATDRLTTAGAIIDVGANIGLFARWISTHNPGRVMVCYEPLPGNAAMIARNCPPANVIQRGLGTATATIRVQVDDHAAMATSIPTSWDTTAIDIDIVRLDDSLEEMGIGEIALMKIDTEGMELQVLDGGVAALQRTQRVVMETHSPELHRESIARLKAGGLAIMTERFGDGTGFVFANRTP